MSYLMGTANIDVLILQMSLLQIPDGFLQIPERLRNPV